MSSLFGKDFISAMSHSSVRSGKPIFVVGMPRSGTTLVEQILSSHNEVHGAGELRNIISIVKSLHTILGTEKEFPECMGLLTQDVLDAIAQHYLDFINELAPEASKIVDKMPGNFMYLGLIEMLFPDAHIVHCVRNPLDTCLSGFFQDFSRSHPYSFELGNLGYFYKQ